MGHNVRLEFDKPSSDRRPTSLEQTLDDTCGQPGHCRLLYGSNVMYCSTAEAASLGSSTTYGGNPPLVPWGVGDVEECHDTF